MQVAVEFQYEIIFSYLKKSETLFYRHMESPWLKVTSVQNYFLQ